MSASGTRELLHTPAGVVKVCHAYLNVTLSEDAAAQFVLPKTNESSRDWMGHPDAVSAGPVCWLKIRMLEAGVFNYPPPDEADDRPIMFVRQKDRKVIGELAPLARSKVFRTQQFIFPIDLTARRVAGPDIAKGR